MPEGLVMRGSGYRGLVLSVIHHAVVDMCRPWPRDPPCGGPKRRSKIQATVWLASNAAAVWLDYVGLDQIAVLEANDWPTRAREILERQPAELQMDWGPVLLRGLEYFEHKIGYY